jgi:hypothetical protein
METSGMSQRVLATATVTVAVVLGFVGCGGGDVQFDPSTKYSPQALAQELAFRYRSLDRSKPGGKPDGHATRGGAITKGGAATKAAQADTFDGLLDDVIAKAATIPNMSPAEARRKVAEEAAKDPTFSEADRKAIADRLGRAGD